jgi:cysteine desulfurase
MTTAFGNASSIDHSYGDEAEEAVKQAAKQVAELVGSHEREIVWTSGATESINLTIQDGLSPNLGKPHVLRCCHSNIKPFSTPAIF